MYYRLGFIFNLNVVYLFTLVQELNGLNIYDILEPCYHSSEIRYPLADNSSLPASFRMLGQTDKPLRVRKRMFGRSWPLRAPVKAGRVPTWPELGSSSVPCTVSSRNISCSFSLFIFISLPFFLVSYNGSEKKVSSSYLFTFLGKYLQPLPI